MLYLTTREKYDAFTSARTLASDRGPEGGLYVPYRMPVFTAEELAALKDRSFGQNVADVLNRFFGSRLTGWDVEFCIGRYPVKIANMSQKILTAECWRNLDGSYEMMERHLAGRICDSSARDVVVTSWLRIAIRIAVLTGIFAELQRQEINEAVDVSVSCGDFTLAMALWYARAMGLPIVNIVCGCGDGSECWNLLHNGQLRSGDLPELERLVFGTLGIEENLKCQFCLDDGSLYALNPAALEAVRKGLYAAVVSPERKNAAIPNVYSTNSYILEPEAAVAYSALMDYRARTGERRRALLLADRNPADMAGEVAAAMKITPAQLKQLLGK